MSPHPQEPPDEGGDGKEARRIKYKRTLSRKTLEARACAGALLGEHYEQLRATCPRLPQAGYLSRATILEGGVSEIRSLQGKIQYLHGQLNSGGVQAPRLPGLIPLGNHGYHGDRGWNGGELQPGLPPTAPARDGIQLPKSRPDDLQIIDVRGGSELLQTDPSLATQVRGENQLIQSQSDSVHMTGVKGGGEINIPAEGSAPLAHARGGWSQGGQGNDRPEVIVLWQGTAEQPAQSACTLTRPFIAGSPPLEERSWIPTPTEIPWKLRPEKVNLFSSTLERVSSSPAKMTLESPISLTLIWASAHNN